MVVVIEWKVVIDDKFYAVAVPWGGGGGGRGAPLWFSMIINIDNYDNLSIFFFFLKLEEEKKCVGVPPPPP